MFRKLRARVALGVVSLAVSFNALALFHQMQITEVYSNADGSVQFIELQMTFPGQTQLAGQTITSTQGNAANTFTFPNNVSNGANGARILIGTPGYAALPGVPAPDYTLLTNNFVFTSNVTINFAGFAFAILATVPTDGTLSINPAGVTAPNSPTNNAGVQGVVMLSNPTPPGPPTIGMATPGNGQATINFTPGTTGSSPTTGFTATCTSAGQTTRSGTNTASPITVSSLTNGVTYSCTVTATNANGTSGASGAVNVTPVAPVTLPGAPTINSVTPGVSQATVNFSPPADNGGGTLDFIATCGGMQAAGPSSPITVFGLANATMHSCTVLAHNSAGNGPASAALNVTLPSPPDAPTGLVATPLNASTSISFSPVFDGGSPITSFLATCTPGPVNSQSGASPITISGLANGTTYSCTVAATNGVGASASSAPVNVTPRTVPGAPLLIVATPGDTAASIAFVPNPSNGGSAIIDFTATCNPGAIVRTNTVSPITYAAGSLANGTVYTCSLTARNAAGSSAASAPFTVTPARVPDAPTITMVIGGDGQASVFFTPPASNGGAAITSYRASCNSPGVTGLTSPITDSPLANDIAVNCSVFATNAIGNGPPSASLPVTPSAMSPLTPVAVYSRKTHGAAGTFNLPVDTTPSVVTTEPRLPSNGHLIVFEFNVPISDEGSATVTPVGSASATRSGKEVQVRLINVPDNQRVNVTLTGVNGSGITVSALLGFLVGDVNNSQAVKASDISAVKSRSGQTTNLQNFKFDLNTTGDIGNQDVTAVKARSGLVLPP
jgi:hypothetical protein